MEQFNDNGADGAPPCSITGVQITDGLVDLLDWMSLTLGDDHPIELWNSLLGISPDEWEELPHGGLGYSRSKTACYARVYFDGAPGMGTHCVLSGHACRDLEARGVVTDWQAFAQLLLDMGVKATRLDPARDDRGGILDLHQLEALAEAEQFTSRAKDWQPFRKYGRGRRLKVHGLAFGTRSSESYLRIYNKGLEQGVSGHWVRVELELKGARAQAALEAMARCGLEWFAGHLRSFLEFKAAPVEGNATRVPVFPAWDAFLSGAAKVKLAVKRVVRGLAELVYHLEHQWAPTLAAAMIDAGGDVGWFYDVLKAGERRMKGRHWRLVRT